MPKPTMRPLGKRSMYQNPTPLNDTFYRRLKRAGGDRIVSMWLEAKAAIGMKTQKRGRI